MIKTLIKHLAVIFLIFILVFLTASFLVSFGAKSMIKRHIEQIISVPVEFKGARLTLPLTIEIDDLNIKGICSVKKMVLYPNIPKLIKGNIYFENIRLNSILIQIERSGKRIFNINNALSGSTEEDFASNTPGFSSDNVESKHTVRKKQIRKPRAVVLKSIILEDVKLQFLDSTLKPDPLTIKVENIHVDINQLLYPPLVVGFNISGEILGRPNVNVGLLNMHGWINMNSKDMKANLKISSLDGVYFEPYIKRVLPSKLLSAVADISVNMQAKDNLLTGGGKVKVDDFELENSEDLAKKGVAGPLSNIVLMGLTSPEKRIEVGFTLANTKLDKPVIRLRSINADIMKPTIESLIENPEQTIDKFRSIADQVESIKDIFKSK